MNLSDATAAPVEVRIGEQAFQASPLDLAGIAQLEQAARDSMIRLAFQSLPKASPDVAQSAYNQMLDHAADVSFGSLSMNGFLRSIGGLTLIVHLSLSKKHPEATLDWVGHLPAGLYGDIASAVSKILRISGMSSKEAEGAGPKPGEA